MTIINFERLFDRLGPALFLGLGAALTAAMVAVAS